MTIYKNMERMRIEHNMTREALARELGITASKLRGWEIGREPIPSDSLMAMADLFDCSVDYLLGRSGRVEYVVRYAS
ncbi:helix-turn-helix domain-containing protein [Zongyangia hominis]|uniref:Helix-turn-helix transcriptional regulator n=1 Tax=Zongyangia hominis TaxID=2763677 RepID=A0A926E9X9_9FIRM|nr:helix-turn-helix transcriptional regulator [Zongyangia hominis]MBC8569908.1 helix-turn-helix transcriptional regulator [Zongyangia hominis]